MVDHVGFVENDSNLVVVSSQCLDGSPELIRNVELVCVKQQNDSIDSFSKPLENPSEIVATIDSLFLARQNSRSVNN